MIRKKISWCRTLWHFSPRSIQMTILVPFTIVSLVCMLFLGFTLYQQFAIRSQQMLTESTQQLLGQTVVNLEDYLRNMRRISDAMYYDVIKDTDLSKGSVDSEMNLLYEANKDNLISFALYTNRGKLISAAPVAVEKNGLDVTQQEWYSKALDQLENLHFSTPHVQNLFDDPTFRYYWVISLSRAVELTDHGTPTLGVLLVDMNYSTIEQMLSEVNDSNSQQYVYLCDSSGELIYHPRQMQINAGLYSEDNLQAAAYEDGSHEETYNGERRVVVVDTVSYTGWKLISVIPMHNFQMGLASTRYFVIMLVTLTLLVMMLMNRLVSLRVSRPLRRLNDSIKDMEAGNLHPKIYIGGSTEVEHLGRTLQTSLDQISQLMKDIVVEQEEKRKSELDALQSQINPHFLYNTLDSIVWMIEGERYDDAVFMVTQLASLFRVSLSKGKTIISIEDELRHAENYMNIQKIRYKNAFSVNFDIEPQIRTYCTVKLIVQPILENAIYYGVKDMDEDGEIFVHGFLKDGDIYISVKDNGFGMPQEEVNLLLKDNQRAHKHGSGVGLINVHNRIQLRFGVEYGLSIQSEPDEGTQVIIHLPAIPYTEETQTLLEEGKYQGQLLQKTTEQEDRKNES
ncbi:MAG: sensor histidine kinase [Butyrivibrio sp.]|nr:sensor histidine kinase [Butyrivibrio sp.]